MPRPLAIAALVLSAHAEVKGLLVFYNGEVGRKARVMGALEQRLRDEQLLK